MANLPLRSGGSQPESYNQARKKKVRITKENSSTTPKTITSGYTARITQKENQVTNISTLETAARAKAETYFSTTSDTGKLKQSRYRGLLYHWRKFREKRQAIQQDIKQTKRDQQRELEGRTSEKQEANIKAQLEEKNRKAIIADSTARNIQPAGSTQVNDIASYTRPASFFEIKTGQRRDDGQDWQLDNGLTYSEYKARQAQQIRTEQKINKTNAAIASSPFIRQPDAVIKPNEPIASSITGGVITRSQAKAAAQTANRVTAKDKAFYSIAGQKEAIGRVGTQFKVLGMRTANVVLPKSKEFTLSSENASTIDRLSTSPLVVFGAPAAYATVAVSVPFAGSIVKAGAAGTAIGVSSVYGVEKGSDKIYYEELGFKRNNPEVFEASRQYATQQQKKDTNVITSFFNLDTTLGGRTKFIEYGAEYLSAAGFSGEDLQAGRLALAAQSGTQQAQEVSFLLTAEAAGEGLGGFSGTGTVLRNSARVGKILLPDVSAVSSLTKTAAKKVFTKEELITKSLRATAGGAGEGGAAVGAQQYIDSRSLKPGTTILGIGAGALTAGVFEFVRSPKVTTKKGSALLTTAANIIEPQEFIVDNLLDSPGGISRIARRGRTKRVSMDAFTVERTGVNEFAVTDAITPAQDAPQRSKAVVTNAAAGTLTKQQQIIRSDTNTQTKEDSLLFTKVNTKINTKTNSLTTSKTAVASQATSLLAAQALSKTTTRSRTLTPPFFLPPLKGGSAVFPGRGGKRGKTKKGYTKSVSASLFGKAYKAIGAKSTDIGIVSGLGVRF